MKKKEFDLIIVGGGILGAFHAYHALNAGLSVLLLEKDRYPSSATVRNFGQIVPSGMNLKWQQYGRRSLEIYRDLQELTDLSVVGNGSVYLASNAGEEQLLHEVQKINQATGYNSVSLTKEQCLKNWPGLSADYCQGGLLFPEELSVDPSLMIHRLLQLLCEKFGLHYQSLSPVIGCEVTSKGNFIQTSNGDKFRGSKVIICSGSEFRLLFPEVFKTSGIIVTKLQMLETVRQRNYVLKGNILTGWSIRRYEAFRECPSYNEISKEVMPEFQQEYGIHILFKQSPDGSVILGDSHEYAKAEDLEDLGFDLREDINNFMLKAASEIIDLPDYRIARSWWGMYSQTPDGNVMDIEVIPDVHIVTGIGGKGMTASPGFSEENIKKLFNIDIK